MNFISFCPTAVDKLCSPNENWSVQNPLSTSTCSFAPFITFPGIQPAEEPGAAEPLGCDYYLGCRDNVTFGWSKKTRFGGEINHVRDLCSTPLPLRMWNTTGQLSSCFCTEIENSLLVCPFLKGSLGYPTTVVLKGSLFSFVTQGGTVAGGSEMFLSTSSAKRMSRAPHFISH